MLKNKKKNYEPALEWEDNGELPVAFHGLAAYSGRDRVEEKARSAAGAEICVADRPIGPVGLVVCGHIRKAFDEDCFSKINGRKRVATRLHRVRVTNRPTKEEWDNFCQERYEGGNHYCEAWMTPSRVDAVWLKDKDGQYMDEAVKIANTYKVPLVVVTGETRIWYDHII